MPHVRRARTPRCFAPGRDRPIAIPGKNKLPVIFAMKPTQLTVDYSPSVSQGRIVPVAIAIGSDVIFAAVTCVAPLA